MCQNFKLYWFGDVLYVPFYEIYAMQCISITVYMVVVNIYSYTTGMRDILCSVVMNKNHFMASKQDLLIMFDLCANIIFVDCPYFAGKWSRPQCHGQVGLDSPAQSFCKRKLPSDTASPEAGCFHKYPGFPRKHSPVSRIRCLACTFTCFAPFCLVYLVIMGGGS